MQVQLEANSTKTLSVSSSNIFKTLLFLVIN